MATFREAIYDILNTDAQSAVAGSLGVLLGYNALTKPNCVFYMNPPVEPVLPLVTYFINTQVDHFPRVVTVSITAWGSNFSDVHKRVFDLLHKKIEIVATDFSVKAVLFDWSGPDLWDEDLQTYYCQQRYRALLAEL